MLETLCCPVTRQRLNPAEPEVTAALAAHPGLLYIDASPVDVAIAECLITADGAFAYRVVEGIPLVLPEKAIPLHQLGDVE